MPFCHYCGSNHSPWQCPLRVISNNVSSIDQSVRAQALSLENLPDESKQNKEYLSAISDLSESLSMQVSDIAYDIGGLSDAISVIRDRVHDDLDYIINQNRKIIELQESFLNVQKIQSILLGAGLIIATVGLGAVVFSLFQPQQKKHALEEIKIAGKCIQFDDLERAIKHLDRAIDTYPNVPQAWIMKAHCFLQSKRMDQILNLLKDGDNWTRDASKDIKSKMATTWGRYYFTINEENSLRIAVTKFFEALFLDNRNAEAGFQLAQALFVSSGTKESENISYDLRATVINLMIQLGNIDPLYVRRFEIDPAFGYVPKGITETEIILRKIYLAELRSCISKLEDVLDKARGLLHHQLFDQDKKEIAETIALCKKSLTGDNNLAFLCEAVHRGRDMCNHCASILSRFTETFSQDYRPVIRSLKESLKSDSQTYIDLNQLRKHLKQFHSEQHVNEGITMGGTRI